MVDCALTIHTAHDTQMARRVLKAKGNLSRCDASQAPRFTLDRRSRSLCVLRSSAKSLTTGRGAVLSGRAY